MESVEKVLTVAAAAILAFALLEGCGRGPGDEAYSGPLRAYVGEGWSQVDGGELDRWQTSVDVQTTTSGGGVWEVRFDGCVVAFSGWGYFEGVVNDCCVIGGQERHPSDGTLRFTPTASGETVVSVALEEGGSTYGFEGTDLGVSETPADDVAGSSSELFEGDGWAREAGVVDATRWRAAAALLRTDAGWEVRWDGCTVRFGSGGVFEGTAGACEVGGQPWVPEGGFLYTYAAADGVRLTVRLEESTGAALGFDGSRPFTEPL